MPDCDLDEPGGERRMRAVGQPEPRAAGVHQVLRPDFVGGWGTGRTTGRSAVGVQHEVVPRVSATVTYNRNWWGNWYVVDNRATSLADYTPFSIKAPLDPRLPNGGGYTIDGLYNLVPGKVGQVDELAQSYKNFGEQTENWQGVDFSVVARLQNGLTRAGGHEHRAQARRRLRRAGEIAGARLERHAGSRRTAP